jgi:deazaflavin-dependent oxidoreductase (nitroreductase family)
MLTLSHRPNLFQRLIQKLAATRAVSWLLSHSLPHIDRGLDRLSRGRFNLTRVWSGLPVVMVTTIGAKSGHRHTVPLAAIPDGNNVILIASWFGNRHHPAWYYNLIAHPDAMLADHRHSAQYQAREVHDSERETYWQRAVNVYAGYAAYKRRVKRVIPIMLLTPKEN